MNYNKELLIKLRSYFGITEQYCSDDELLESTKNTLGRAVVEFSLLFYALIAGMEKSVRGILNNLHVK